MTIIEENLARLLKELPSRVRLIAVSKNQPDTSILEAYRCGQRLFGENRVQEMVSKHQALPAGIEWHLIGHLQTNKVKYIIPFVSMIHSIDSPRLLLEVSREAARQGRVVDCLLQVHIAREETKFGLSEPELKNLLDLDRQGNFPGARISGLMGMATFTDNLKQVRNEFKNLNRIFTESKENYYPDNEQFNELSMGMSGDYQVAIEEGSTMVRIGTLIFGARS